MSGICDLKHPLFSLTRTGFFSDAAEFRAWAFLGWTAKALAAGGKVEMYPVTTFHTHASGNVYLANARVTLY